MPSRQPSTPTPHRTHFPTSPLIAAGAVLLFSFLLLILLFIYRSRRKRASAADSTYPRRYSIAELKKATCKFSDSKRIGQGGFGSVYLGTIPGNKKQQVAVKLMDSGSLQGEKEFQNELLVAEKIVECEFVLKLLGFGSSKKDMMLVYEYMCNGSLQDALLLKKDVRVVKVWEVRYLIALDVAKGIEYLHSCDPPIVHCDVKPSNVLLSEDLRAKIGDFGLARFKEAEDMVGMEDAGSVVEETESVTTMTTVGMDDFSVCVDQSPESLFKGLSDEQSPMRSDSRVVGFPRINEGMKRMLGEENELKEILVEVDSRNNGKLKGDCSSQRNKNGAVKEYVMEWIGTEVKREWHTSGVIGDSSRKMAKSTVDNKTKKVRRTEWWKSLAEENSTKKSKRRPTREWWKKEYAHDFAKKQAKKKRRQTDIAEIEYVDTWWPRNDRSSKGSKSTTSRSKRSRGSLDWWLDGLSGESSGTRHHSSTVDFPRSCAMSSTPSTRGTLSYVAPEYGGVEDYTNFSDKCDVYSYGVLLLVIIAGRRPLQVTGSPVSEFKRANLVSWARHLARAGKLLELVDISVESVNQDQALCCIKVALLCLQKSPARRPCMKEVVGMLSGGLSLPELPYELSPSPRSRFHQAPHKMYV